MKLALKIFAIALVIFISSCKKEDNLRREKMILLTTSTGWKTIKVEQKTTTGSWVDATGTPPSTTKDDLLIFYNTGEYAIDEGPTKIPGNPQITDFGNWTFTDSGKKIQIIGKNLMEIIELNDKKLIVFIESAGQRYTFERP